MSERATELLFSIAIEGRSRWGAAEIADILLREPRSVQDEVLTGLGEIGFHLEVPRFNKSQAHLGGFGDPGRFWGAGTSTPLVPHHLKSVREVIGLD